jgi:Zn-dependent metalloprotease
MDYPNINANQRQLLTKLQSTSRNLEVRWDTARGALSFARSSDLGSMRSRIHVESDASRSDGVLRLINEHAELFGLPGTADSLRLLRAKKDYLGFYHHEYQLFVSTTSAGAGLPDSIEVYGSRMIAHIGRDGSLIEVQSSCYAKIQPGNVVKIDIDWLRGRLHESIRSIEGFDQLEKRFAVREKFFPLTDEPRLVIYLWQGRVIYSWAAHGYGATQTTGRAEGGIASRSIVFGQMFFNAETGELFLFAPMNSGAETQDVGSGLSTLPLGGPPFNVRPLNIVCGDDGTYRLKDVTRERSIIIYDANADAANSAYPNDSILTNKFQVSENQNRNWDQVALGPYDYQRTASQQPEVDGHANCMEIYDWYAAIGNRVGWDNNCYCEAKVPCPAIKLVAHAFDNDVRTFTSRSVDLYFALEQDAGKWYACIVCFDGDPTGWIDHDAIYDYPAGSKALVAHEYQHGVTNFSVDAGNGNPGGIPTHSEPPLAGWGGAVQEGLSDAFAGLFSGDWWMGREISPAGQVWRNLAYPPDPSALSASKADHWDDRNSPGCNSDKGYFRGCILAHAAYLMAEGGVHQRSTRSPSLIPVRGLGREIAKGQSVYRAARFWYRMVAHYLSGMGAFAGDPTDEDKFRKICDWCVNSAADIYGDGSVEHKTAILAWYAVGLQPPDKSYGADVTFLTRGADWRFSNNFVRLSSPDRSALDLFINNAGRSEWVALINVNNGGNETQFENNVFARVRNIGDQPARQVEVTFEYAKVAPGGAISGWFAVVDKQGDPQILDVGTLGPGESNFPDTEQDVPPAAAGVKWCIPMITQGEQIDHFCLRAIVASDDDVNEFNNDVLSDIDFGEYVPSAGPVA